MSTSTAEPKPATPRPAACRVTGVLDQTLYEVVVTGNKTRPVVGSRRVRALVEQRAGGTVTVSPVGPAYTVDPGDVASVVALLSAETKVQSVTGGPDLGVRAPVDGVR